MNFFLNIFRFIFSKAFWINAVIAVILLFFAVKWILGNLNEYTLHGQSISVPDFKGIKIDTLEKFISDKEIQYIIVDSVFIANKPRGIVVEQDPKPESLVKKGRKIYLTVNAKMPMRVAIPDLADVTLRQATAILESYGLKVGNKKYIPDQCFNCVLRTEIKGETVNSGTMVEKGATIDLVLGQGQSTELSPVPDLYGMKTTEMETVLASMALNFLAVSYEGCKTKDDSMQAQVFKQSPPFEKNVSLNLGSTINVWLTCDKGKINIEEPDTLQ